MKIVLMYHDIFVSDPLESGFSNGIQYKVKAKIFEDHVKNIAEYCKIHNDTEVEFTFDDGGISFLTEAAPILEKYGFKGLFFISTKYIGTDKFLSICQIKELIERGHRIGLHTHTHPYNMLTLSYDEILIEWKESFNILNPYIGDDVEASIPNGFSNNDVVRAAFAAGINKLYTSDPLVKVKKYQDMDLIGRYAIYQENTVADVLSIITSNKTRLKRLLRAKCLNVAKKLLGPQYVIIKKLIFKRRYLNG